MRAPSWRNPSCGWRIHTWAYSGPIFEFASHRVVVQRDIEDVGHAGSVLHLDVERPFESPREVARHEDLQLTGGRRTESSGREPVLVDENVNLVCVADV